MLHIDDLVVRYGSAVALDGVSLHVERRRDGRPGRAQRRRQVDTGQHRQPGCSSRPPASVRCEGRVAQVPEGRQMFADMTVEDNLLLGGWSIRNRDLD